MAAISSVGTNFVTGVSDIKGTITAISLGGISTAEIDVTSISSSTKEYVMGTLDGGTVDVTVNLDAGVVCSMPTAGDTAPTSFTLRFGTGAASPNQVPIFTFSAYIQSVSVEAGVDAQVTASYTLRISGAISVGLAAS